MRDCTWSWLFFSINWVLIILVKVQSFGQKDQEAKVNLIKVQDIFTVVQTYTVHVNAFSLMEKWKTENVRILLLFQR